MAREKREEESLGVTLSLVQGHEWVTM